MGACYRGPIEQNGVCATQDNWLNPARINGSYASSGWNGPPGTKIRAVQIHESKLDLPEEA